MTALLCTPVLVAVPNESHSPSEAGPLSVFQPLVPEPTRSAHQALSTVHSDFPSTELQIFPHNPHPTPTKAVPKALVTCLIAMTDYPAIRKLKEEGFIFGSQFKSITATGLSGAGHMMSAGRTQRGEG